MSVNLKLIGEKTELIVIRNPNITLDLSCLRIGAHEIRFSNQVQNLGLIFDCSMSMDAHVNAVCKMCHICLHNISSIWHLTSHSATEMLVHVLVSSKLLGLPQVLLQEL